MSLALWVLLFVISSLFSGWVLFWGGAEWLEGSFVSLLVVSGRAANWSSDGIKIFVALSWLASLFWFVIGLFDLDVRHFFTLFSS
jgi:hypothetical protein